MHLVVNAWPLCVDPQSVPAFHLRELLDDLLEAEAGLELTLVGPRPAGLELPNGVPFISADLPGSEWGRLRFEQRALPRLAGEAGADAVFSLSDSAPLRSPVPVIALAGRSSAPEADGFLYRVRRALATAGLTGAAARLRWSDEGAEASPEGQRALPPSVGSVFRATDPGDDRSVRSELDLPPGYVLCLGAERIDLPILLAAWTWVDASVGDTHPLVFVGLSEEGLAYVDRRARELHVDQSVMTVDQVEFDQLPAIYRGAEAFLHPGYTLTGQELRWALATGIPIACAETPYTAALLGDAAYLAPRENTRSFGASCLTLLVERREVAQPLREKGLVRAGRYHGEEPRRGLIEVVRETAEESRNERS